MLNIFRVISFLEGLSYLVILSVTLGFMSRAWVFPLGMAHGVLFLVYLIVSLQVSNQRNWSVLLWFALFLAAFIPLAFILVEIFLRKEPLKGDKQ